ncbi:hypothetical protein COT66_02210 [Candidatus Shapirobacteria bacterium CG09_land_8_20_14_0_10_49_15]|uniref:Uncharacterized protein n=2 Tax=Candidatus Shapironibacteriota TaxID=1752721 RepID=A0A2M8L737_9BACT|nr:MAG: hypothetical protein COT66_02210 [Candidatus Shapirobacteria bacterium CG09_land_8_20_14_0_10_49_15]PJE70045.1 MAG: hypothetical protein COU97_01820 [Candidatus Shapirobacteria bacterium CG10_big_fil_rev_8_21_14_0_10_48_15]
MKKQTAFSKMILIGLVLIYLIAFKNFPYFNLILQAKVIAGVIFLLAVCLFSVSTRVMIAGCLLLLVFTGSLVLMGKESLAQTVGDMIYFLLLVGVIKKIKSESELA